MLEHKWTLFVRVAFDTRSIDTNRELGLLRLKTAVSIVTIAAFHRAFKHLVVERFAELRSGLGVAT